MLPACRFIRAGKGFAADCMSIILKTSPPIDGPPIYDSADVSSTEDSDALPDRDCMILTEEKLNEIYLTVLKSSIQSYTKYKQKKRYKLLREATGAIVLLFSPLSAPSLAKLLDIGEQDIMQALDDLHSILNIPEDPTRPIRLHHPSFRDFLLDKSRCGMAQTISHTL